MIKGLMYGWNSSYETAIKDALASLVQLDYFESTITDYNDDASIFHTVEVYITDNALKGEATDFLFSVNYIPVLSKVCDKYGVKYVSWIVDNPMTTLYSKTVLNPCNYIFTFDRTQLNELKNIGVKNCYSMALGTNTSIWNCAHEQTEIDINQYKSDISFMGNLYNDENTDSFSSIKTFPAYISGYLEGIMQAQLRIYGYNFIDEMLSDGFLQEMMQYFHLENDDAYFDLYRHAVTTLLNRHISRLERKEVLDMAGNCWDIHLYTNSNTQELTGKRIINRGYADYRKDMPYIFRHSKINLNITSKSIISGIPLRVFDVLGNGGFLISNYQPELAELFEDGKEIVMYQSMEDLKEKIAYYLSHEDERRVIAQNGYVKVCKNYTFAGKIADILKVVME